MSVTTRVAGIDLDVFPSVFHPRYFGSSSILAKFVSSLDLNGKSFLEVGCGSGIVSLCAARAGARVTAVDINPDAVRCSTANAGRNRLTIDVRVSDLFSAVAGARFDVIAWNPPFLPGTPQTPAEAAFYGGPDFEVIRRFCREVSGCINAGGAIYTIVSSDVDIPRIEQFFRDQRMAVSRVGSTRWGLGEAMVILCAR